MGSPLHAFGEVAAGAAATANVLWFGVLALVLLAAGVVHTTAGWMRARRRLAETLREREDLANSSLVIEEERRMLELIANGAPLREVLDTLTKAIERISAGAICSIMLLDEEQHRYLSLVSGPSLPPVYQQALRNNLEIGPEVGACGTAAFCNQTVIIEDVATDPKFAPARDFILSQGLRSCWSQPVRDSRNKVLGTFAMYHRYVASPRPQELRIVRAAAQLTGNAIERMRAEKALSEAAQRLNLAERVAHFGVWEADYTSGMMTISTGMAVMMECQPDRLRLTLGEFEMAVHPDDREALRKALDPTAAGEGTFQSEFRLVLRNGTVRWMRSQWRYDLSVSPPVRATGAMIDITQERRMLADSQQARNVAEAAARAARQAERLEQDRKTILEMVAKDQPLDDIAAAMAGAIASHLPDTLCAIRMELNGAAPISVYSGPHEALAGILDCIPAASIRPSLRGMPLRNLSTCEEWLARIDSSEDLPYRSYRAVPIMRNAQVKGMLVSFCAADAGSCEVDGNLLESWGQFASLAIDRRGLYDQLSFRAQYDSLTTLLNRASLYERVDALLRSAEPGFGATAVIYIDLDHFKPINDKYGHGAGDKVLQDVARRIQENIRRTDFAARIGGDEFVVVLPGVDDAREATRIASLLVSAIEEPVSFNGRDLRVGASYGVSIHPEDGPNTDALLTKADEAMYRLKMRRRSLRERKTEEVTLSPAKLLSA